MHRRAGFDLNVLPLAIGLQLNKLTGRFCRQRDVEQIAKALRTTAATAAKRVNTIQPSLALTHKHQSPASWYARCFTDAYPTDDQVQAAADQKPVDGITNFQPPVVPASGDTCNQTGRSINRSTPSQVLLRQLAEADRSEVVAVPHLQLRRGFLIPENTDVAGVNGAWLRLLDVSDRVVSQLRQ